MIAIGSDHGGYRLKEEIKKDDVQVNKEISKEELKPTNKKKIIFRWKRNKI